MGYYRVSSEYYDTWWLVNTQTGEKAIEIVKHYMAENFTNNEDVGEADWDVEFFELRPGELIEYRDL